MQIKERRAIVRFEYTIKECACPACQNMATMVRTSPFSADYRCMACLALLQDGLSVVKEDK